MNTIEFPRQGYDGKIFTKKAAEDFFIKKFEKKIRTRLANLLASATQEEARIIKIIDHYLDRILIAEPRLLELYKGIFDSALNTLPRADYTKFKKELLYSFNYYNYRQSSLITLAKKLNVKTCPYCNMHYSLYAEDSKNKRIQRFAKLQYDHFIDKSDYPVFSMSLYNLIPSCAVCNQGKSRKTLSLSFHPYLNDNKPNFHFKVDDPIGLLVGASSKDQIEISLVADNGVPQSDVDAFDSVFHLKALYGRHRDVIQEIFDKAYEDPYYLNPSNFSFLSTKAPKYLERLWLGNYTETFEIEKRPMAKFQQDMWKQAKALKP